MSAYVTRGSRVVYDGVLANVRIDRVMMPDGQVAEREIVEHPDAVAVVPVTDDGDVVLVRQYRHAIGQLNLEIPAGLLDVDGEEPRAAALRELAEETGYEAGELVELVRFHNSGGWSEERTTVYLATGLRPVGVPDGFEAEAEEAHMAIEPMAVSDALRRARAGEISDAKTLIGLLLAAAHL